MNFKKWRRCNNDPDHIRVELGSMSGLMLGLGSGFMVGLGLDLGLAVSRRLGLWGQGKVRITDE